MSQLAFIASTDNPRPGRMTYTVSQFWAEYEQSPPARQRRMLGLSPGAAAVVLGISRQSVHRAIDRGTLEAHYVYSDDTGELAWITVPIHSLQEYARRNGRRAQ